ncbi:IS1595 family transposase [Paragemmobacter ruber]|uniref:IS1595 family transposase n=1 Tax=Paragemmobacter ruber TaxID=1985673 RepID=A0ABW9Y6C5_9RHOB|nr:IS1595 family transposase [Rhodobacter ruber]NBE08115.1 IS1595 family transposase [Rhodobacter ruber]
MSILSRPEFHNEEAAYAYVEARVWANGRVCPHCGECERTSKMGGKSTRIGTYKCYSCRKPFTVKIGTIFESSHVPMNLWLQAIYLMCASKKGISSNQLHRTLGVTLKTAWFMSHRIREAMRDDSIGTFGSGGGAVEVDETFIGREPGVEKKTAYHHKMKVVSLLDRETGRAKSIVVDALTIATIAPILSENIAREATLYTDEAKHYRKPGKMFAAHGVVEHGKDEYVRGDVHTNTIEGYFSIFKRGMKGIYQHCGKKHLHRYMAEFDFRYSNRAALDVTDAMRADIALNGIVGKRLLYRDSLGA